MEDDEIFKICTEYWNFLADDLYNKEIQMQRPITPLMLSPVPPSPRLQTYSVILSQARRILIDRMPKPEVRLDFLGTHFFPELATYVSIWA